MNHRLSGFLLATLTASIVSVACGHPSRFSPKGPSTVARPAPSTQTSPDVPTPAPVKVATDPRLAETARALIGTWRCRGSLHGADGASPSEVTLQVKLDLDAAWLKTELRVTSGKYGYGFDSFRTFDRASQQWVNVILDNLGGHAVSRSTDGVTWTGESTGPMGDIRIKDTETLVSPGAMNMLGQYSPDGTSWRTGYELSCEK